MTTQEALTNREKVKKMQAVVFEILCDIDKYCKENNLTYFLSGGSVLGAIRHHGFIPWDDDADIMLPRTDYEKFVDGFSKKYKDKYGMGALSIDPSWNRQWAKIWNKHTKLKYKHYYNHDIGVFIDVYPIDGLPNTKVGRKVFYAKQKVYANLAKEAERKHFHRRNRFQALRKIVGVFVKPLGARFFVEKIDALGRKYSFESSEYVACSMPVHYGARETIKRELMSKQVWVLFENRMLPVPVGYETYLSNLYGEYMVIPKDAEENGFTHLESWEVEFDEMIQPKEDSRGY